MNLQTLVESDVAIDEAGLTGWLPVIAIGLLAALVISFSLLMKPRESKKTKHSTMDRSQTPFEKKFDLPSGIFD